MYRNTRYDAQDYSALGLTGSDSTAGAWITVAGTNLIRSGQTWRIVGHAAGVQKYGSIYSSASRATMDAMLDAVAAVGVNSIAIAGFEQYSVSPSGTDAGLQVGCFDNGHIFSDESSRTWVIGDYCQTTEGSNSRTNVYICTQGGLGTGTTGPTGTGTGIANGATLWNYVRPAHSVYAEAFFAGGGGSGGLDYFLDGCRQRGIYVYLRFNGWQYVFKGNQSGYPYTGGGNLSGYCGAWPLDGETSTPTYLTYQKAHLAAFLNRVNTVNGIRYGADPTIFAVDVNNENGVSFWYYNTTSTSSPTANTFDKLCAQGSAAPGVADINSTVVAWWDAQWLAWYAAAYPGHTPNGDFGTGDTLPCHAYTGAMGSNVAARGTFRVPGTGTAPSDTLVNWRKRVAQFLGETERTWYRALKTYVRTLSPALIVPGQSSWVGTLALVDGDFIDAHYYASPSLTTDGNTQTVTGTMAAWGAGTVTVNSITGVNSVTHPLRVGQQVRVTQTASPFNTAVYTCAGITPNTAFTATAADPGWTGACSIVLPNTNQNFCEWHNEPPTTNVASSTRMHGWDAGTDAEVDYDVASYLGQSNFGNVNGVLAPGSFGKPKIFSELGAKGLTDPHSKGIYRNAFHLTQALQGCSGGYFYLWANSTLQTGVGEHLLTGDGCSFLATILAALVSRNGVTLLPTTDNTLVTEDDVASWYAAHNTTQLYSGATAGWSALVTTLGAGGLNTGYSCFLQARLSAIVGDTSAKTNVSYAYVGTGETLGGLTSSSTGRLWHKRNLGYVTYEDERRCAIFGRIPTATDSNDLTKMELNSADGKHWYGLVWWESLDGSALGVGRSALFTWMYPREEVQRWRARTMTARIQDLEMLDGDYSGSTDASTQPGVVMRNGLRVKLTMADTSKRAQIIERYAGSKEHPSFHSGGAMALYPTAPLLVIG